MSAQPRFAMHSEYEVLLKPGIPCFNAPAARWPAPAKAPTSSKRDKHE